MLNKCWKRLAVVLVVGTVLAVGLVGCNEAEVPEAEVIESEVVSETVSEEVSEEITSEAESESAEEENGGVEYFNFADRYEMMAYLKGLKKTIVIDYDFSEGTEQAIISNGGKYTLKDDNNMLSVISTNKTIDGKKYKNVAAIWITNIDHGRRHKPIPLMTMEENIRYSKYSEIRGKEYQKYDNYDAIEVPYTSAIPRDYTGLMGVPITFLEKFCPEQINYNISFFWKFYIKIHLFSHEPMTKYHFCAVF